MTIADDFFADWIERCEAMRVRASLPTNGSEESGDDHQIDRKVERDGNVINASALFALRR